MHAHLRRAGGPGTGGHEGALPRGSTQEDGGQHAESHWRSKARVQRQTRDSGLQRMHHVMIQASALAVVNTIASSESNFVIVVAVLVLAV